MKYYFLPPFLLQKFIWVPTRLILSFFADLHVIGLENLKEIRSNAIFAANHAGEIDPFLVPSSLSFFSRFSPLFYATREKSFYDTNGWRKHLFGGIFINAWGGYGVKVGMNNYEESLKSHLEIIDDGGSFCIFPEGGITQDGNLGQGKGGVTYLAAHAKVPIVPVAFIGTYRITPKDFFLRKRKIKVCFGRPIYQEDFKLLIPDMERLGVHIYKEEVNHIMKKIGELMSVNGGMIDAG